MLWNKSPLLFYEGGTNSECCGRQDLLPPPGSGMQERPIRATFLRVLSILLAIGLLVLHVEGSLGRTQ